MLSIFTDEHFMKQALKEAEIAFRNDEVPVGAVVVCKNQIIARAHNQTEMLTDVTAHAEMLALTSAADFLGGKFLEECRLFVTIEPCVMCAGALYWSRIGEVIYGARDEKRGFSRIKENLLHPKTMVKQGVMEYECSEILKSFFLRKR